MIISTERTSNEFLRLNSCARQYIQSCDVENLRENGRADWHILYIEKGFCHVEINGIIQRIPKGNIILFYPYEKQHYSFYKEDGTVSCYIHFCGRGCREVLKNAGITEKITYIGESGLIGNLFTRLCEEYTVKKPFCEEVEAGILYEFFAQAGRLHEYHKNNSAVKNVNFMNEICSKMYEELPQNKSIKHYADMCCLSVDRFSHSFKESMGISPMGYIMNMRVRTACELLSNTNLTLAAVAENVGITDVNYFCRMIKKYTGNTPGHYRK